MKAMYVVFIYVVTIICMQAPSKPIKVAQVAQKLCSNAKIAQLCRKCQ